MACTSASCCSGAFLVVGLQRLTYYALAMQSPPGLVVGAALLAVATVVQRFLSDCACTYTGGTALLHPNSSCRLLVVWWQASVQQKRVRCAAAVVTVHWLPVVTAAL